MNKPKVVFFGSGPVASRSLELLLENFEVVAVVTKPKPLHHKGNFPVLDISAKHNLPTFTVSNKKELSELITTKPFHTDAAILIDFGIIVAQDVIDYFPKGIINSHFSLLPEWRGADPITFSILSGQDKTGVSLMLLVAGMDEGPVLSSGIQELDGTETSESLTNKLILLSDALLKEEIPRYLHDEIKGIEQDQLAALLPDHPAHPTYSRKLTKDDGVLDFSKPSTVLEREVRAYSEWPKSRTNLAGIDVIITQALVSNARGNMGSFEIADKQLLIYCSEGALNITMLKPAGKQSMATSAFIAGYGTRLISSTTAESEENRPVAE